MKSSLSSLFEEKNETPLYWRLCDICASLFLDNGDINTVLQCTKLSLALVISLTLLTLFILFCGCRYVCLFVSQTKHVKYLQNIVIPDYELK